MELIVTSYVAAVLLLVGQLGVLVHRRVRELARGHGQD